MTHPSKLDKHQFEVIVNGQPFAIVEKTVTRDVDQAARIVRGMIFHQLLRNGMELAPTDVVVTPWTEEPVDMEVPGTEVDWQHAANTLPTKEVQP